MPMVTSSMQAIRSQIMTAESMPESVRGISTLGGASGQAAVPAPPPKSKAPLFVGLGVGSLVLVGAVVGALSLRKPDKATGPGGDAAKTARSTEGDAAAAARTQEATEVVGRRRAAGRRHHSDRRWTVARDAVDG